MTANQELDRPFPVICFGWYGTAVAGRHADAAPVRGRVERLCALGADVAVVSGASVETVDRQLRARPGIEGRLFLLLCAGSEVYVVGPGGPRLLERRQAGQEGEEELSAAAEAVRSALVAHGLDVRVDSSRLNRRSIDLVPGWRGRRNAPPERVRRAVQERLTQAGFTDLDEALSLSRSLAGKIGLMYATITSDVRHIEIGLTDKADSMQWVTRHLLADRDRDPSDLIVISAEFAAAGAVEGRDAPMLVPDLEDSLFVSVGAEPAGVPPRIVHLGGGPSRLLELLDAQIDVREREARENFPQPTDDPAWLFRVEGFDPFREREVETWLTVANGETGTRGSLEEGSAVSTPATFVAGVFGDGTAEPRIRQPVPAPDWLCLRLRVNGTPHSLSNGEILEHHRVSDMRQGVVFRDWLQRDRNGRLVRVRTARFASLDDRSLLAVRAQATLPGVAGELLWEGCIGVSHAGGPVAETAIESLEAPGFLAVTRGRHGGGHALAVVTLPTPGSPVVRQVHHARDLIGGRVEPDEPASVDRLAAVVAARSGPPSAAVARAAITRAQEVGFDELLRRHREAWERCWEQCDVRLDGDPEAQLAVRFSVYHMLGTAHPGKDRVSIGARGLSGSSYFGHVFWDTEVFAVPFFIYTQPETARTLLTYRYRNLDGARQKARTMGHLGALFPWESADRGVETTPPFGFGPGGEKVPILSGLMEHHIAADVAWAVWEYWMATDDDDFMVRMGVEIMLETARFWVSRASRGRDGAYHVPLVVGPDEYHEAVDDNAYTNVLARWNIRRGLEALEWLEHYYPVNAEALRARLEVADGELRGWRTVADGLVDGFDPRTKLFEQFAGFFELDDVDPAALRPRPLPADMLLGRKVTSASKVIKQADVVMLCYLLSDEISDTVARANYEYYEPITVHGSSLSPGIHACLAAQLGMTDQALEAFRLACAVDLADNMGSAASGLHLATMGGIWQAVVMGFGGVRRRGTALVVDPHLPAGWHRLGFTVCFRRAAARFDVEPARVGIRVEGAPLDVIVGGARLTLEPGEHRFERNGEAAWQKTA